MGQNCRVRPSIEPLECRRMLSAAPVPLTDLTVDEVLEHATGGPTSVYAGGTVYFSAVTSRDRNTAELWKIDPVTGQTAFMRAFGGPLSPSAPVISNMASGYGSMAYFVVTPSSSPSSPTTIWVTDGTPLRTQQLSASSGDAISVVSPPNGIPFVRRGDATYFAESGGVWRIDDASPFVAKPVAGGGAGFGLTVLNGALYFLNNQGTAAGLYQVNDAGTAATRIYSAVTFPASLTAHDGALYFFGVTPSPPGGVTSLYKSDGTAAGTQAMAPVDYNTSSPPRIVGAGANVYFVARTSATGDELWKSDGTAAGTSLVADLRPGTAGSLVGNYAVYHDQLHFTAVTASGTGAALWKTDGTPGGTVLVSALDGAASSAVLETAVVGDALYVGGRTLAQGYELWRTDAAGTRMVSDRYPGRGSSRPRQFLDAAGTLYYQGVDPVLGYGLFKTDGTAGGTVAVKDYLPGVPDLRFVNPYFAGTADGRLFYADGDQTGTGRKLFVTDGTAGGTRLVRDLLAGSSGSTPEYLATVGNTVYFSAQGSFTQGAELWKSDGTAAGTVLVKNIHSDDRFVYSSFGSDPRDLTNAGGTVYFSADDGVHGRELWKSDGTDAGTVMYDLNTVSGGSSPQRFTAVGSTLFFTAENGANSGFTTLYKIAPGDAAPVALKSFKITANVGNFGVDRLTNVNGTLYFAGDDGVNGMELWKSNGTPAGTVMVKDIRTIPDQQQQRSSRPQAFVAVGNYVVFSADDGVTGRELWRTDGTTAGTVLVKDIYPNRSSDSSLNGSQLFPSVALNGWAYFWASDEVHGSELWRTDGTAAGTAMIKDIRPGSGSSSTASGFTVAGGRLYFSADDGVSGAELWSSDGTEAGTIRVADLNPGAGGSMLSRLRDLNGSLVFMANDGVSGTSLFRFDAENVKPTASAPRFLPAASKPAVTIDFDEDVSGSLAAGDLVLTNLTTGQAIDPAAIAVAYDAANNRAAFTFPGLPGGVLLDGNYHVSIAADVVRDTSNNPLAGDVAFDFFVLGADANLDRVVNFDDLLVLAKNYNKVGVAFEEGDFNYDGLVNFDDLLILAKAYNKVLAPPPPPPPSPAPLMTASVTTSILPSSPSPQDRTAQSVFSTKPVARPAPAKAKPVAKPARHS